MISHVYKYHLPLDLAPFFCLLCLFRCCTERDLIRHVTGFKLHRERAADPSAINFPDPLCKSASPYFLQEGTDYRQCTRLESQKIWADRRKTASESINHIVTVVTPGTITAQSVSPVMPVYGNLDARIEAMLAESTSPPAAAMPNLAMNEVSLPTALPLIVNCQPLANAVNPPPVIMGGLLSVALPPEDNLVTPVDGFPELSGHGRTGLSCLLDLPGEEDFKPDYSDLEIEEEEVVVAEPRVPPGEAEPRVQQNNPPEHSTLERALVAHTDALRESTEATKANTAMMTKYMTALSKQSTESQKHVEALTELSRFSGGAATTAGKAP